MVQVPGSRQWLVVVQEPWRVAADSNVQRAAESFPNPGPWVRGGPELAERWYQEAKRVVPRVQGVDPRRLSHGG